MALTVGSLFSGIGGLDLGLERAEMQVIWQSEIDTFASRVLAKHWPGIPNHGDIKRIEWGNIVRPDVICGGYPCQPFSLAGKRRGEQDERHLWPYVLDAISHLRPRYAILENVRGHLTLGGTTVIGNLADIGYDAEWRIVSASSVGANHRRDRLFIVAYPNGERRQECDVPGIATQSRIVGRGDYASNLADPDGFGCVDERPSVFPNQAGVDAFRFIVESGSNMADPNGVKLGGDGPTSVVAETRGRRDDYAGREVGYVGGEWWQVEPGMGRVANGVPDRVDRLRALGNAVVPQVAEIIGRLVVRHASLT